MPPKLLENKSNPTQPCGDLEYTVRWLVSQLQGNLPIDPGIPGIRGLDKKLCRLILKFKETVDNGYPKAASTARAALMKGFREIRFGLASVGEEDRKSDGFRRYIDECMDYLDRWMNLIDYTMMADVAQENVQKAEETYKKFLDDHEKLLDAFEEEILRDPEKLSGYYAVVNEVNSTASLTKEQADLRLRMIEYGVQMATGKVKEVTWRQLAQQQTQLIGRIEVLRTDVMQSPIPNFGSQSYTAAVEGMLQRMAAMDKEIEESVLQFADLSGKLDAMEYMPGAEAARNYAARGANQALEWAVSHQNRATAPELKNPTENELNAEN
ncbi:MAG: hypothetical protein IKT58_00945 [Oscillospiraceae bacterium]|nr:hypothetical protein [Oscillospiraceae bacterium]